MGFDAFPAPTAPVCEERACNITVSPEVVEELSKLGLNGWASSLASVGLTNMEAFRMIESTDDLPNDMPNLVKKQLVRKAEELRAPLRPEACVSVTFKIISENRLFELQVHPHETLTDVRLRFPGFVPSPNKVCYEGVQLEESQNLYKANVVNKSILYVIPISGGKLNIYVKTPSGSVVTTTLCPSASLATLVSEVASKRGCPVSAVTLSFNGVELHDKTATLHHIGATDGCCFRAIGEL